ncbi:MAG: hypothetical protein KIT34_08450 [Cyanobacteria bacterium TGS_CYA1]|nr:hypothetical protein [Cyanobacteria bacterium TGS_CYA1]
MTRLSRFIRFLAPGQLAFWLLMGFMVCYSLCVVWFDDHYFPAKKIVEADAVLYTSSIIGLLLIFRNNSAYERWWEARKLWGQLVNETRNLCIKADIYVDIDSAEKSKFGLILSNFNVSLMHHLRGTVDDALRKCMEVPEDVQHLPLYFSRRVYEYIERWRVEGKIDSFKQMQFDNHARAFMDICGASERILASPISGSYKLILWIGIAINLLLIPWMLVPTLDQYTILAVILNSYFMLSLEFLAEEVERPFGTLPNELPLERICQTISNSIKEVLKTDL